MGQGSWRPEEVTSLCPVKHLAARLASIAEAHAG